MSSARFKAVLLLVATITAAGCGNPPMPPTGPSSPAPTVNGNALVIGRVTDADNGQPVAGATVSTKGVCYSGTPMGRCTYVDNPSSTTADDAGKFELRAVLPPTWESVELSVTRTGYENLQRYVGRADAKQVVLPAYSTITIRPGDTMRTNLVMGIEACGWLSINCRRIAIASPNGVPIDIEVSDGHFHGLHPNNNAFADDNWPTVLTISNGEAWILGAGPVTVTARAR